MEFKYLVKVDKSNTVSSLRTLANLLGHVVNVFDKLDVEFIQDQDYITAVPVEIALSVQERQAILEKYPETRYIITGVRAEDVQRMQNYGYEVHATRYDLKTEEEIEAQKQEPEEVVKPEVAKETYWVNGKKVTEEEYNSAVENFRKEFKEAVEHMPRIFGDSNWFPHFKVSLD